MVFSVFGCKESIPPIVFGDSETLVLQDTAYFLETADIPESEYRGILIEDLTGVRCINCPDAAEAAAAIKETATTNPVVILGLYPTGFRAFTTPYEGYVDLRTETAQNIGANIYNFFSLPAGGVNRRIFDGETERYIPFSTWANRANTFSGEKAVANLDITIDQVDDSTFNVNSEIVFTENPDAQPFISIFLLEDNIKHQQDYSGGSDKEYKHKHVVRKAYTPYNGTPLLIGEITEATKGLKVEKGWQIAVPEGVDVYEASVAVFLNYNDNENKEVIQCTEVRLK